MSEFWDNVRVINNPNEKEIIVSFDGSGGYGAFGSNNPTNAENPGGLPTGSDVGNADNPGSNNPTNAENPGGLPTGSDVGNADNPNKPVIPEQEDDGTTMPGAEPDIIIPESGIEICKPQSCTALNTFYAQGGSTELGYGINPIFSRAFGLDNYGQEFEHPTLLNALGGGSGVYCAAGGGDILYPNGVDECLEDVETFYFNRQGMPTVSRYPNYRSILDFRGDDPATDGNNLSNSLVIDYEDVVFMYMDTTMLGSAFEFAPVRILPSKFRYFSAVYSPGNVPVWSASKALLNVAPEVVIESAPSNTQIKVSTYEGSTFPAPFINTKSPDLFINKEAANGWWRLKQRIVVSFGGTPVGEFQGRPLYNRTASASIFITSPGRLAAAVSVTGATVQALGSLGVVDDLLNSTPGFQFFGDNRRGGDSTPRILAFTPNLNDEAVAFSRSRGGYIPPPVCEIVNQ